MVGVCTYYGRGLVLCIVRGCLEGGVSLLFSRVSLLCTIIIYYLPILMIMSGSHHYYYPMQVLSRVVITLGTV